MRKTFNESFWPYYFTEEGSYDFAIRRENAVGRVGTMFSLERAISYIRHKNYIHQYSMLRDRGYLVGFHVRDIAKFATKSGGWNPKIGLNVLTGVSDTVSVPHEDAVRVLVFMADNEINPIYVKDRS